MVGTNNSLFFKSCKSTEERLDSVEKEELLVSLSERERLWRMLFPPRDQLIPIHAAGFSLLLLPSEEGAEAGFLSSSGAVVLFLGGISTTVGPISVVLIIL